jgi:hypothetical protein
VDREHALEAYIHVVLRGARNMWIHLQQRKPCCCRAPVLDEFLYLYKVLLDQYQSSSQDDDLRVVLILSCSWPAGVFGLLYQATTRGIQELFACDCLILCSGLATSDSVCALVADTCVIL